MTTREEAQAYIDEGYQIVPLSPGTKACKDEAWLKLVFEPNDFQPYDNLGIRSVNGLVVVDLDAPEAVQIADDFLPPTNAVYGRPSKLRSKRLFRSQFPKTVPFKFGGMIVEIRSEHQDMAPPSIHPSGERLEWVEKVNAADVTEVSPETLRRDCQLLSTAVLISRHYANEGERHDWMLQVAGTLRVSGVAKEEADKVVAAAARLANDTKVDDRLLEVRTTYNCPDGVKTLDDESKELVAALQKIWPKVGAKNRDGFETNGRGVIASRANIVKALEKLGVTTRLDTFSSTYYVMSPLPRVLDDDCVGDLRIQIDEKCHFLPPKELFEDVIQYLGRQNKFNPVCDYLDSLRWDGTPRIDTWLRRPPVFSSGSV